MWRSCLSLLCGLNLTLDIKMFRILRLSNLVLPRLPISSNNQSRLLSTDKDTPLFDIENPFEKEKPKCILCQHNITPDYKNVKLLSQFQSPYTGRIYGRHITGLCEEQQTRVEKEIVKAQDAGLMATYLKEVCYLKDPQLFDAENPLRPHRF